MNLDELKAKETELLAAEPLDTVALKTVQDQIAQLEQAQAHEDRVTQATTDFYSLIDSLDLGGGITLRQIIGNEDYYQLATMGIKGAFQAQADNFSKQIGDQQKQLADLTAELKTANDALFQEKLDHANTEQGRKNAADQLDEANKEIARLNQKVDEQRQEISLGVRGSISVVNSEDEKKRQDEIAAKFKREHTVYDVVADDPLNPKTYSAKLAYNDQPVTYSWIAKNSYTVIDANEVQQFRSQYPAAEPVPANNHANSTLDQPVQTAPSVEPPALPEVPQFPEVQSASVAVDQGNAAAPGASAEAQATVTRAELEARLEQFAKEHGLVKTTETAA